MIKTLLVLVGAWLLGVFGWTQIAGSLQNLRVKKYLALTLILWVALLLGGAYVAIAVLDSTWSLIIGYVIAILQVLSVGKIER